MKSLEKKNRKMSLGSRACLICVICLVSMPIVFAQRNHSRPAVDIGGIYENFTVGKGSGDLEGMRVVIFAAGGAYRAIVQIAQGGAEDPKPEFVDVEAKGMNISFTVGEQKFTGKVTAAGLTLKNSDGTTESLKRKPCSSFFSVGP